jgi:hypothetical protein
MGGRIVRTVYGWQGYRESCNGVVRAYHEDIEIDIRMMQEGIAGVYWAEQMGTHASPMFTLDQLPARGRKRRYLFGEADAREIVKCSGATLCKASEKAIHHYFDGVAIKVVSREKAESIIRDYQTSMSNLFDEKRYPH